MIEILDIENDRVVISPTCLSIPELKAVMEEYKDPIPALSYLYHMCSPKSPYANLPEDSKEEVVLADFPGDYSPEEEVIVKAIDKLNLLYLTPTRRFFLNAKKGLETLGNHLATVSITDGRDSNFAAFNMALSRVGKTIEEFKKLEKIYEEETKSAIRGGHSVGYDE